MHGEDCRYRKNLQESIETPPRAWGRLFRLVKPIHDFRNTPTCMGKTRSNIASFAPIGKHPHVHGEDFNRRAEYRKHVETPPRAWGRPPGRRSLGISERNTPTCMGKTSNLFGFDFDCGKHPHVHGEDLTFYNIGIIPIETPPRAWGRPS